MKEKNPCRPAGHRLGFQNIGKPAYIAQDRRGGGKTAPPKDLPQTKICATESNITSSRTYTLGIIQIGISCLVRVLNSM